MKRLRELLDPYFETDNPLVDIAMVLLALLVGAIIHFILFRIVRGLSKRSSKELWRAMYRHGKTSTFFLILLLCFMAIKPLLDMTDSLRLKMNHIIALASVVVFAWTLIKAVTVLRASLLYRYDVEVEDNLKARKVHTQFKLLGNIIKFMIVVVSIGIGLMTFESIRHFGVSLLASAGIAGIILGFAAQKLIATVLAGLQLAITQPIRIDDVVIVEGEWGKIEEITLTYVVVRIWDKRRLIVPTTYFIENPFQNWTRVSADILGTVFLYTDYTLPVDELRAELTRILNASPHWDGEVNVVQVTDAKERTMEVRALMSAHDSSTAWNLRVEVREKLIGFIQKNYPDALPATRVLLNPDKEGAKDPKGFPGHRGPGPELA